MPRLEDSRTLAGGWSFLPQTSRPRRGGRCGRLSGVRACDARLSLPAHSLLASVMAYIWSTREAGDDDGLGVGGGAGHDLWSRAQTCGRVFHGVAHIIIFGAALSALPRRWNGWSAAYRKATATKIQGPSSACLPVRTEVTPRAGSTNARRRASLAGPLGAGKQQWVLASHTSPMFRPWGERRR